MTPNPKQTPAPRRWVSLTEGAEYIDASDKTLRRMIAAGTVTGYRMGRRAVRVDLNELDALMRPIPSAKTDAPDAPDAPDDVDPFGPAARLAQPTPARSPRRAPSPHRTPAGE